MKLTATVTAVSAKSGNRDGQRKVTLTVAEAESMDRRFSVVSGELQEDAELILLVLTKEQAAGVSASLDDAETEHVLPDAVALIRDQLRPDVPVPFLVSQHEEAKVQNV